MTKISGADLERGHYIKHHGRIYRIEHLEDADNTGARYGDFEQINGEIVCFNIFEDSEYEVRQAPGRSRKRMVKVDRTSLAGALSKLNLSLPGLSFVASADRIIEQL